MNKKITGLILFLLLTCIGFNTGQAIYQLELNNSYLVQADGWVLFNTKSFKFHNPGCKWAKKCTVNCIKIKYSEAVKRGGIPCKVCGGVPQ